MEDALNNAYDDAFRTMMEKCDDLVFPMLNYMFGEHYGVQDRIIRGSNEELSHRGGGSIKKRITDSQFAVLSKGKMKKYHIECQADNKAGSLLVRIFEYGSQIALDDAVVDENELRITVEFPHAGALFLKSGGDLPEKMAIEIITPDGVSVPTPYR